MKRKFVKPQINAFQSPTAWGQDAIEGECLVGSNPSGRAPAFCTTGNGVILPQCNTGNAPGFLTSCASGLGVFGNLCDTGSADV